MITVDRRRTGKLESQSNFLSIATTAPEAVAKTQTQTQILVTSRGAFASGKKGTHSRVIQRDMAGHAVNDNKLNLRNRAGGLRVEGSREGLRKMNIGAVRIPGAQRGGSREKEKEVPAPRCTNRIWLKTGPIQHRDLGWRGKETRVKAYLLDDP
ncbi:hypothetical protein CPB84DRAFT_1749911 [Gymnopilus junonius]|uniref:Uncharacterized protein n=1 Tax=Gymnopilus junonius TaxID=109634 RepID=A0A9P5NJ70_GYMJU|nr:hypothetical protein CPB84DRAFT_1749911 [Gymnopilus junonius]